MPELVRPHVRYHRSFVAAMEDGSTITADTAAAALRKAMAGLTGTALALDLVPIDEVRVITRALTPLEINYLQDPKLVYAVPAQQARADMAVITADKDPAVQKAFQDLTDVAPAK